jgi:hypothetical protein
MEVLELHNKAMVERLTAVYELPKAQEDEIWATGLQPFKGMQGIKRI